MERKQSAKVLGMFRRQKLEDRQRDGIARRDFGFAFSGILEGLSQRLT